MHVHDRCEHPGPPSPVVCVCVQAYGLMGPLQRQHLASVSSFPDMASQVADTVVDNSTAFQPIDLQAPLSFLALLFRQ